MCLSTGWRGYPCSLVPGPFVGEGRGIPSPILSLVLYKNLSQVLFRGGKGKGREQLYRGKGPLDPCLFLGEGRGGTPWSLSPTLSGEKREGARFVIGYSSQVLVQGYPSPLLLRQHQDRSTLPPPPWKDQDKVSSPTFPRQNTPQTGYCTGGTPLAFTRKKTFLFSPGKLR